jgi:hypothetical protein
MSSSCYQTTLTAALALVLGVTLSTAFNPGEAIGYPMGTTVSLGSNPIESKGGFVTGGVVELFAASADAPFIVKDVVLSQSVSSECNLNVKLSNGEGSTLAQYSLGSDGDEDAHGDDAGSTGAVVSHQYATGVVVAAGDTLSISRDGGCGAVSYSIAGYHAHP